MNLDSSSEDYAKTNEFINSTISLFVVSYQTGMPHIIPGIKFKYISSIFSEFRNVLFMAKTEK